MSTKRILEGPIAWEVLRFGGPLALGGALQTTFNLADAYLVAHLPPADVGAAVGALGLCDQLAALGTILSYGVSTAASVLVSQAKGAGDDAGVRRTAWQSMIVVAGLSLLFGLIGLFGSGFVVETVIGAKGAVAEVATRYLRVMVGGSFSIFFLLQLSNVQRALGSSKTPVAILLGGNVLNIVVAILFIYGPGPAPPHLSMLTPVARALGIPAMGMMGAAWATLLARSVTLVPTALALVRRFSVLPPAGARGPDGPEIRRILTMAWPSSAQFVVRIAAMLLVSSIVARRFTTDADQTATTAMGLVFRLDTMVLFVAMGWGSAAQTFVGQNVGASLHARARRGGLAAAGYGIVTSALVALLALRWGETLLRAFDDEAAPVAIAMRYLRVVAPAYLPLGIGIVLGNAMVGAGATKTTLAVDVVVILLVQLPVSLLVVFGLGGGIDALFGCVAAAGVASAIAYGAVYWRGGWLAPRA